MASTNQSPFYKKAEAEFLQAITEKEKIACLEVMIKECPKHKSSENMLANLKTRLKKLKQSIEKKKKFGKQKKQGIKKSDMQSVIIGFPNTGKSSVFKALTNQNIKISPYAFTTYEPILGTTTYEDVKIQLIDTPPFPNENKNLINSTDTLLLIIDNLNQIEQSKSFLEKTKAQKIVIFNKSDLLDGQEKRKISETLKSKKLNFALFSTNPSEYSKENLNELKKKLFGTFIPERLIRIYTKEPKKSFNIMSKEPMILKKNSTVKVVAEKILKGMSKKIKKIRIWGPSSKFSGQVVGLEHILKDKDIVEFQTR